MSLFGALTTGVSGMNAQSRAMGNISENLANTQTTGFKRADTRFSHLVTNSSARINTPGAVIATPAYQNNIQGTLLSTQSSTDIAISGGGFFAIADSATSATTTYTRRGDFALDKDGYLVNGAGKFLRGWEVNNQAGPAPFVPNTSSVNPVRINQSPLPATPTTDIDYIANLPANAANGDEFTSSIQVFDQFGNVNTVNLTWEKTGPEAWSLTAELIDESGGAPVALTATPNAITFEATGANAGTLLTPSVAPVAPDTGGNRGYITLSNAALWNDINLDLGLTENPAGTTQFSDVNEQVSVRTLNADGSATGQFRDLAIDKDGFITANYSNGKSLTLYQVPLANFSAPNALQRLDSGAYAQTSESGVPTLNAAGRGGTGSLTGSALEGSNVDVADEFSKMIVTQRIFSANARSISTSDQMLEEVVNLKR